MSRKYDVKLSLVDHDLIEFECTGYAVGEALIEFALGKGVRKWFRTETLLELTVLPKVRQQDG